MIQQITYHPVTKTITPISDWGHSGGVIQASLTMPAEKISLEGLQVGITIRVNGQETVNEQWPKGGQKPKSITTFPHQVHEHMPLGMQVKALWKPLDDVEITVFLSTEATPSGVSETFSFTAPIPTKPYPSWELENGIWVPPVPCPNDGEGYGWDEDLGAWVIV